MCVKILKDRQHTDEARKELEVLQGLRRHPLLALPIGCVFAGMLMHADARDNDVEIIKMLMMLMVMLLVLIVHHVFVYN